MKGGALSIHRLNHILKEGPVHFELDKTLGFASRVYLNGKDPASLLPLLCARNKVDG
jgi:hypothetical protein